MLAASQRHHDDPSHKHHGAMASGLHHHHHHHHHHHAGGVGGVGGGGVGGGAMSMSCSPAPDSSQDGVHDLDDEKLDVVGTSDGRDGASPLHISDGKWTFLNTKKQKKSRSSLHRLLIDIRIED